MDRLLDVSEVAELLGLSRKHVYGLVESGRIPHLKLGRLVRFHPDSIEAWIGEFAREPRR